MGANKAKQSRQRVPPLETTRVRFLVRERKERDNIEQMNSTVEEEHSGEEQVNQEKGGDGASLVESREVENETNKEERRVEEVQEATEKLKL